MLLPFKTYGFVVQNLWFHALKPMFFHPKTYVFYSKHLISSFKKNVFSLQLVINQSIAKSAS